MNDTPKGTPLEKFRPLQHVDRHSFKHETMILAAQYDDKLTETERAHILEEVAATLRSL